jgi:hypothetical protein
MRSRRTRTHGLSTDETAVLAILERATTAREVAAA